MTLHITSKILRWGNSYAVRLSKPEAERAGLRPGMEIDVSITHPDEPYDVSDVPTFRPVRRRRDDQTDAELGAELNFRAKMDA